MHNGLIVFGISLMILTMFFAFAPIFAAPLIGSFSIFQGMTLAPDSGYEEMFIPLLLLGLAGFGSLMIGCFRD